MIIFDHIVLPIIMISVCIYAIAKPLKAKGTMRTPKFFRKTEETLIFSRRAYAICLLIFNIPYAVLSMRVLLGQIELSSLETVLILLIMVIVPSPLVFIMCLIRFDKNGIPRQK